MSDMEILNEVAALRARVDAIDHKQEILIRAQRGPIERAVLDAMEADPKLAQVYLQIDGKSTQKSVVASLAGAGIAMSQPTVSRKMDVLEGELALIEPTDRGKDGVTYRKSAVDRILRLSPKVSKLLKSQGLPGA